MPQSNRRRLLKVSAITFGSCVAIIGATLFICPMYGDYVVDKVRYGQLPLLVQVLDVYRKDHGVYPSTEEGLSALAGTYIRKEVPRDPWGSEYVYRPNVTRTEYVLYSR